MNPRRYHGKDAGWNAATNRTMRFTSDSILHRLVGLLLAVLMPVCCCTTQVLGATLLSSDSVDGDRSRMVSSCCGSCVETDSGGSSDAPASHEGCQCVRGQLETSSVTGQVLDALAHPPVAHPRAEIDELRSMITGIDPRIEWINGPPEDSVPGLESRRLRRIIVLQV